MRHCKKTSVLLTVAALAILSATTAGADDVSWINELGGNFSDGANWDTGSAPGSGDHAIITLDGTYTVALDTSPTVQRLTLGATSGTQNALRPIAHT